MTPLTDEDVRAVSNQLDCGSTRLNRANAVAILTTTDEATLAAFESALIRAGRLERCPVDHHPGWTRLVSVDWQEVTA